jgi:hypothetical protein
VIGPRLLLLGMATACAPLMGPPMPIPLPEGRFAAAGMGVAAPAPLHQPPETGPTVPVVQGTLWATFALGEQWEAGPLFVLDQHRSERNFTGGLFVRRWVRNEPTGWTVGVRGDAGWGWLGASLDLSTPLSEDFRFALSPGILGTPKMGAARLPASIVLRIRAFDAGLEFGLAAAYGQQRLRATPYGGLRLQLAF